MAAHPFAIRTTITLAVVAIAAAPCGAQGTPAGHYAVGLLDHDSYVHFHQERLFTHLGDDRGYGAEHDLAALNIESDLIGLGWFVTRDTFNYRSKPYYNVVAERTGTSRADEIYIVGAHFDSVDNPGADDDASGVAAILEIARLVGQWESEATIRLIAFDREEQGLIGSAIYASRHWTEDIRGMISLDMIAYHGGGDYACRIHGQPESNSVKLPLKSAVQTYGPASAFNLGPLNRSDHASFEQYGIPAVVLVEFDFKTNPHYHWWSDSIDTPGYINYDLATRLTRGTLGWLVEVAGVHPAHPKGDCDGSYVVDSFDVGAFALALANRTAFEASYPGVDWLGTADINGDGAVDSFDIGPFVGLLTGP